MTARLLTPSKITAWLSCEHALTLQHQLESGAIAPVAQPFGSFARLLANKGLEHEAACLAAYRAQGLSVVDLRPQRERKVPEDELVAATLEAMRGGEQVIVQAALHHENWFGYADVLRRVAGESALGAWHYEAHDTKLARETR